MNEDWLDQRAAEVRASIAAIEQLDRELPYLQLGWRPPEGGWSIAQVFEHLIMTDQPYNLEIPPLLARAPRGGGAWKPSFLGGIITRSVLPEARRKVNARPAFRPAPEPRANVLRDYVAVRQALLPLIEQSKGVDLNRTRIRSPVVNIIRYNLGDAYMILTRHTQRHLQQVARIRSHPEFPLARVMP